MAARLVDRLPEGPEWLYEVKFDGYRALLIKNGDRVEIRSRNDKNLTTTYPGIAAAARRLDARQATVDGEVVAVDANGRPSFQALQHRSGHAGYTIVFYAFDLLHLDGMTVVVSPLIALMKDQADKLRELSLDAVEVNSSITGRVFSW